MNPRLLSTLLALTALVLPAQASAVTAEKNQNVESVANGEAASIRYHLFLPDGASAENPVPAVLQTHGWGGTGSTSIDDSNRFIQAGYALLTWDERGFGASGGKVHVDSPEYEGVDAQRLIDVLAADERIAKDGPGDPQVGMSGGSYAGGIQFVTAALDDRVDAIAPEIAWNNLYDTLSPEGVIKIAWGTLLYAAGLPAAYGTGDGYDMAIHRSFAEGTVTGTWTHQTREFFESRGPWYLLEDITAPTFIIQAAQDTLFPPSQAIANYEALEASGKAPLKMAWYCGGHGVCAPFSGGPGGYTGDNIVKWFDRYVKGDEGVDTGAKFEYLDQGGTWNQASGFPVPEAQTLSSEHASGVVTIPGEPAVGGALVGANEAQTSLEVPFPSFGGTAIGTPVVHTTLTTVGTGSTDRPLEAALFFRLVNKTNGQVLGHQTMPHVFGADVEEQNVSFPIEAVSYDIEPGDQLVLEVNSSDANYLQQRGAAVFDIADVSVDLPVVP